MCEIERCLLQKPEVFVYKIPPRQSARGYRAADWNLTSPDWTGRLRVMSSSEGSVKLKLEDKGSNELFAACPVAQYPGPAIEAVTDSSRYFVIKIVDDNGRSAFIGIGFSDRSDSFDLNVALQDHFKQVTKEEMIQAEDSAPKPELDLAFKAGQTIKVNINIPKSDKAKSRPKGGAGGGLLLPPPGSMKAPQAAAAAAPGSSNLKPITSPEDQNKPVTQKANTSNIDLLGDLGDLSLGPSTAAPPALNNNTPLPATNLKTSPSDDPWGDFASAGVESKASGNWVQF